MSDLTSNKTVDRIAILVSGQGVEQLLGVPSIPSGSVDAQAEAVVKLVEQWSIAKKVSAIYFNTTASNTGAERGACVLIEEKLKKYPPFSLQTPCHEACSRCSFQICCHYLFIWASCTSL